MIGEDPDLEKSGRILNRVIEWGGGGITIETDQTHVREILKGLELERANHTATPCAAESKNEGNARNDERKGENGRGQRQAQTKHEWDDVSEGDDRYRPRMADDDANDSQALTGGDITRYRALVARINYLSQDRPDLKFCFDAGMLCDGDAISAGHGACKEDRKILRWEIASQVLVPLAAEWRAGSAFRR